jgi:hypothetical protein
MLLNEIGAPVNGITASTASPDAPDKDLEPGTWTRAYKTLPPVFLPPDTAAWQVRFPVACQSGGAFAKVAGNGGRGFEAAGLSAAGGGHDRDPSTSSG